VNEPRVTIDGSGLAPAELQALFRLVVRRPPPSPTDVVTTAEAVLVLAASVLKGYGVAQPLVLMVLARFWAWLEDDDGRGAMFNVVDRRYVGWGYVGMGCGARNVLIDAATGADVAADRPLPRVLENVAYNLYELLERRLAMARGERALLWEGRDAPSQTPCGAEAEGGVGLGEPPVLRDDPGAPVPR